MLLDLRDALRLLARHPATAAAAALTLAVGLGAVTGVYTLVRGVLLAPLDYPQPEGLLRVHRTLQTLEQSPNPRLAAIWNRLPVSYLDALDLRRRSRTLAGVGLFEGYTAVLEGGREPEEVAAARLDAELLRVLGVAPVVGRGFGPADVARRERLVLLSHALWARDFGADERIVGRAVRLDGEPHTVAGVMPRGFALAGREDRLWTPFAPSEDDLAMRDDHRYTAIARLAPGASLAAARDEAEGIAGQLAADHPEAAEGAGFRLVPLLDSVVGEHRGFLGLLGVAAVAVLAIACANVAHLLLAQGSERRRELATRLALGADRSRLVRLVLTQTLLLAAAGGLGGLLLAAGLRRALPLLLAEELPRLDEVAVNGPVVAFAAAASLATALLAGLLPAVLPSTVTLRETLAERGPGRRSRTVRDLLVVAEVALTMTLAAGAVLLAVSWLSLAAVEPGFAARGVLVQELRLPAWTYPDEGRRRQAAERLLARLEALPGVRAAALTSRLPTAGPAEVWGFRIAGRDPPGGDWTQGRSATMHFVTPGYLRLLGIPLLAGRPFHPGGGEPGRVVVVNRTLAERHWPGGDAVGGRVTMGEAQEVYTVVGVVADVRHRGAAAEPEELMIQPWSQRPPAALAALVAVEGEPLEHAAAVRAAIRRLDPGLPLPPAAELQEILERSLVGPRSRALLLGLSAGVALFLALVGTYGMTAFMVGRRRREIGIRMALGADAARIRRLVLGRTLALALAGVVLGTAGALAAGGWLASLLFGVRASDPVALGAVALLVTAGCLAAGWPPARRASRTDPARTLQAE